VASLPNTTRSPDESQQAAYALTLAGRTENNVARFEEAVPILREAIAVQRRSIRFRASPSRRTACATC
jgi:hypothetical protein